METQITESDSFSCAAEAVTSQRGEVFLRPPGEHRVVINDGTNRKTSKGCADGARLSLMDLLSEAGMIKML